MFANCGKRVWFATRQLVLRARKSTGGSLVRSVTAASATALAHFLTNATGQWPADFATLTQVPDVDLTEPIYVKCFPEHVHLALSVSSSSELVRTLVGFFILKGCLGSATTIGGTSPCRHLSKSTSKAILDTLAIGPYRQRHELLRFSMEAWAPISEKARGTAY